MRSDNLRLEGLSSQTELEQSREAENSESLLTINTNTAPSNLTPPLSPKSHEENFDLQPGSQGDIQLETTNSQHSAPRVFADLTPTLQPYHPEPMPEIEPIIGPESELEAAFGAKLVVEPAVEARIELQYWLQYGLQLETQAETQARPEVETQVQAPTLGLVGPCPQDKKIPVWAVVKMVLVLYI